MFCSVGCYYLASVKKYDNTNEAQNIKVPPYTETGANTFGAFINGNPWTNLGKTYVSGELGGYYEDNIVRANLEKAYPTNDSIFTVSGVLTIFAARPGNQR